MVAKTKERKAQRKAAPKARTPKETAELEAQLRGARLQLAKTSFIDFLSFVQVLEPPPGRGIIPFEMWDHCKEVAQILPVTDRVIWGKARQIGATTILAAYVLWKCYEDNFKALLFSQGESEAEAFLAKISEMHAHLPPYLQLPTRKDVVSRMEFVNGSTVRAFPSTKKAGRSWTASLVIMDEGDFHEFFKANYTAVSATVGLAGAQLFIASTWNPDTMPSRKDPKGSFFKELYIQAARNGFRKLFYGWDVVPSRDAAWLADREAESADQASFEKEYPPTEQIMMQPAQALRSFDVNALMAMREFTQRPVENDDLFPAINYYQHQRSGGVYMAGTDVAHGVGLDYSATVVIDVSQRPAFIVADILDNLLEPEELALASMQMLSKYGYPIWAIEDNERGKEVIRAAEDNIFFPTGQLYRGTTRTKTRHQGWHTGSDNRWLLWGQLKAAVKARQLLVPNEDGLDQFFAVQRNPDNLGYDEAMGGGNDDYPMAVAIAWQMRNHVYSWNAEEDAPRLARRF